ncbi:MAG: GIY-YIG nuclease family protein [Prevotella sp.]|nr:GIY-YIG nuclease family protein [Prevotella sp.]
MVQDLLSGRNEEFDNADKKRVRLIRHKDNRKEKVIDGKSYFNSLYDLYLNEHSVFLSYQSEQVVKRFKEVDYIVSFIGEESCSSRFVGVYKNEGIIKSLEDYNGEEHAKFEFTELYGFDLLKEKVIIDWQNPVSWLQNYVNQMPVIRIDRGIKENNIPIFTRFEDVVLDYNQLKLIIETNHAEWKAKLESCNGIYLILDKKTGKQYVGSTYNTRCIWGRWTEYAKTGHGGDKDLKPLLENDEAYAKKYFQWCILETLPLKILEEHAIDRESLYKRKFGTREFGYNNN